MEKQKPKPSIPKRFSLYIITYLCLSSHLLDPVSDSGVTGVTLPPKRHHEEQDAKPMHNYNTSTMAAQNRKTASRHD